ncbi:MAG: AEC family transporter [Lentisphaeria bacterium]
MDWTRLQDVIIICVPVFATIGLGKILERNGVLNLEHRNFANWLTYHFALPALILGEVARQRFVTLMNAPLILAPILAIVCVALIYILLAKAFRIKGVLAAAFVFGTFWANVSYMGFPLAKNAFQQEGLALAAVYNAFIMPVMVVLGFLLIGVYGGAETGSMKSRIRRAFVNPVIIAAFVGIAVSLIGEIFRADDGTLQLPATVLAGCETVGAFLRLIGGMGLPLALLAVGGSMHLAEIRKRLLPLSAVLAGKIILLPLFTLLLIKIIFPQAAPETLAIGVLLSATPNAVASYVVSRQIGIEEGFVSSMLVLSTAVSVLSLPVWLYFIL